MIDFSYEVLNNYRAGTYHYQLYHRDHVDNFLNEKVISQPFTIK